MSNIFKGIVVDGYNPRELNRISGIIEHEPVERGEYRVVYTAFDERGSELNSNETEVLLESDGMTAFSIDEPFVGIHANLARKVVVGAYSVEDHDDYVEDEVIIPTETTTVSGETTTSGTLDFDTAFDTARPFVNKPLSGTIVSEVPAYPEVPTYPPINNDKVETMNKYSEYSPEKQAQYKGTYIPATAKVTALSFDEKEQLIKQHIDDLSMTQGYGSPHDPSMSEFLREMQKEYGTVFAMVLKDEMIYNGVLGLPEDDLTFSESSVVEVFPDPPPVVTESETDAEEPEVIVPPEPRMEEHTEESAQDSETEQEEPVVTSSGEPEETISDPEVTETILPTDTQPTTGSTAVIQTGEGDGQEETNHEEENTVGATTITGTESESTVVPSTEDQTVPTADTSVPTGETAVSSPDSAAPTTSASEPTSAQPPVDTGSQVEAETSSDARADETDSPRQDGESGTQESEQSSSSGDREETSADGQENVPSGTEGVSSGSNDSSSDRTGSGSESTLETVSLFVEPEVPVDTWVYMTEKAKAVKLEDQAALVEELAKELLADFKGEVTEHKRDTIREEYGSAVLNVVEERFMALLEAEVEKVEEERKEEASESDVEVPDTETEEEAETTQQDPSTDPSTEDASVTQPPAEKPADEHSSTSEPEVERKGLFADYYVEQPENIKIKTSDEKWTMINDEAWRLVEGVHGFNTVEEALTAFEQNNGTLLASQLNARYNELAAEKKRQEDVLNGNPEATQPNNNNYVEPTSGSDTVVEETETTVTDPSTTSETDTTGTTTTENTVDVSPVSDEKKNESLFEPSTKGDTPFITSQKATLNEYVANMLPGVQQSTESLNMNQFKLYKTMMRIIAVKDVDDFENGVRALLTVFRENRVRIFSDVRRYRGLLNMPASYMTQDEVALQQTLIDLFCRLVDDSRRATMATRYNFRQLENFLHDPFVCGRLISFVKRVIGA